MIGRTTTVNRRWSRIKGGCCLTPDSRACHARSAHADVLDELDQPTQVILTARLHNISEQGYDPGQFKKVPQQPMVVAAM
jgi:hypothetical protein